jgi:ATP-dependent Clp protease ATP-binding subunit ClpA
MQTEIKDALTDEILFGRLEKGGQVYVDCRDDRLTFSYDDRRTKPLAAEKAYAPE